MADAIPYRELSGRLDGGRHVFPVRVYYEDTDAVGIVYHANYLRWAERARTEMMRLLGAEHASILDETGVAFAVRRCTIEFDAPARLDDTLEVHSTILDIRGASIEIEQNVRRVAADGAGDKRRAGDLVRISLTLCCLNRSGRPVRLPAAVSEALRKLGGNGSGDSGLV